MRTAVPTELNRLLQDQEEWTAEKIDAAMHAGEETTVTLKEPVPVHLFYFTAWVDSSGVVQFRPDIYGYDARHIALWDRVR